MSSVTLELNCLVVGDDLDGLFSLKLESTEKVGDLKKAIKAEKQPELDHVAADKLDVRQVSVHLDDDPKAEDLVLAWGKGRSLRAPNRLRSIFSSPPDDLIHILVKAPPRATAQELPISALHHISLNCYVLGDDSRQTFPVKIASSDTVGDLKKAVKAEKSHAFENVDADALDVWKVSLPADSNLKEAIDACNLVVEESLPPTKLLSGVFSDSPVPEYVHIVVKRPLDDAVSALTLTRPPLRMRREVFFRRERKAPSSHGKPVEFERLQLDSECYYACSRPPEREPDIPLALIDPVFGDFIDNCKTVTPTGKEYRYAQLLREKMCQFYPDEKKRGSVVREIFQGYGINIHDGSVGASGYLTDGQILCGQRPSLLAEMQNEIGTGSAEPTLQVLLYYDAFCNENKAWQDTSSSHPCFVICLAGPHLIFGGCALTDRCTLEIFSSIPLTFHASHCEAYDTLARHLLALQIALTNLNTRYTLTVANPSHGSAKAFRPSRRLNRDILPPSIPADVYDVVPYPTTFADLRTGTNDQLAFTYGERSKESTNLLFSGETKGQDPILVKFVRRYGKDVHTWCADRGYGPKLLGFKELCGGWFMVIMERLDESWVCLADIRSPPEGLKERIRAAVTDLHQSHMVHGDLRSPNVMVKKDGKGFMLIDYDWAGLSEKVKYPMLVNKDPVLRRPAEVEDCVPILPGHDDVMFENMFP